jgi:hypothetical protein
MLAPGKTIKNRPSQIPRDLYDGWILVPPSTKINGAICLLTKEKDRQRIDCQETTLPLASSYKVEGDELLFIIYGSRQKNCTLNFAPENIYKFTHCSFHRHPPTDHPTDQISTKQQRPASSSNTETSPQGPASRTELTVASW